MRLGRAALVVGKLPEGWARTLEERGFRVESVIDDDEAVKRCKEERFDVCVVTVSKRKKLEMRAQLEGNSLKSGLPIVMVIGPAAEQIPERDVDLEVGAGAFMTTNDNEDFIEVIERACSTMGGVVPAPEDDGAVKKVFDFVSNIKKKKSVGFSIKKEKKSSENYREKSLQQLIEKVEEELSGHLEVMSRVTASLEEEGLDVIDLEAEIEPLISRSAGRNKRVSVETGNRARRPVESKIDLQWLVEEIFIPLYTVLGCSVDDGKEEITEAYAVKSDKIRKMRPEKRETQDEEEMMVLKSTQRLLDAAFDVLSKETVRNIVKRSKLEKSKKRD